MENRYRWMLISLESLADIYDSIWLLAPGHIVFPTIIQLHPRYTSLLLIYDCALLHT